jgi:excisionase family DNA binding protein
MARKKMAPGKLLSPAEAADRVGLSERTIERYIEAGKLPAYRAGTRLVKLRESDVEGLLKRIDRKPKD